MKQLFSVIALLLSLQLYSQDSTKIEQYCRIVESGIAFSNKVAVEVDFGEVKNPWLQNRLKDEAGNVKKFNSIIDALNYFGKQGWKLVNAFLAPAATGSGTFNYIMKKEFRRAELE